MFVFPPASFLAALGGFLRVRHISVCQDEETGSPPHLASDALSLSDDLFYVSFVQQGGLELSLHEEDSRMIICPLDRIKSVARKEHFTPNLFWVVESSNSVEDLSKVPLSLNSNFVTYQEDLQGRMVLTEWFKIKGGEPKKAFLGTWSLEGGLDVPVPFVWNRRSDMGGATLVNGVLLGDWPPMCIVSKDSEGVIKTSGLLSEVLDMIRTELNLTVHNVTPDDDEYGRMMPNGTWTGLVRELQEKRIDTAIAGLTISRDRSTVMDYTLGVIPHEVTIIARDLDGSGTRNKLGFWAYMTVFSPGLWILTGLFLAGGGLVIGFLLRTSESDTKLSHFLRGLSVSYLAMLQLGLSGLSSSNAWKTLPLRIAILSVTILFLILFIAYGCDLTSFLSSTAPPFRLSNFEVCGRVIYL